MDFSVTDFTFHNPEIKNNITSCAFTDDSLTVVGGFTNGVITIWDFFTQAILHNFYDHCSSVLSIDATNKYIVSTSSDKTIRILDIEDGSTKMLEGHTSAVTNCTISPDRTQILSASMDCTAKLWSIKSGRNVRTCEGTYWITGIGYTSSEEIVVCGANATIKKFSVN